MNPSTDGFTSFKELDSRWAANKGSAFRAFKRALPRLQEGRDFLRLDAVADREAIQRLRSAGRVYSGSVHVVLLSDSGLQKLTRP